MRTVYVGDPHGTVGHLEECGRLIRAVAEFAREQDARRIVFLGDLFDTMSVVRLEVAAFWRWAFAYLIAEGFQVVSLVGNHDYDNAQRSHALEGYSGVTVVDGPVVLDGILHLPYVHEPARFVELCRAHPTGVVVCHQAFDGAEYENGFYAGPEAVDQKLIPQTLVISGHVHKPARLGKVVYLGASRWRIASDANTSRALVMFDHDATGKVRAVEKLDLSTVCRQILQFELTPENLTVIPPAGPLVDVRVDVRGPTAFVLGWAEKLAARGVRVRTFRTDAVRLSVRESEGVGVAWGRFVREFRPSRGTGSERVAALAAEVYGLRAA